MGKRRSRYKRRKKLQLQASRRKMKILYMHSKDCTNVLDWHYVPDVFHGLNLFGFIRFALSKGRALNSMPGMALEALVSKVDQDRINGCKLRRYLRYRKYFPDRVSVSRSSSHEHAS